MLRRGPVWWPQGPGRPRLSRPPPRTLLHDGLVIVKVEGDSQGFRESDPPVDCLDPKLVNSILVGSVIRRWLDPKRH